MACAALEWRGFDERFGLVGGGVHADGECVGSVAPEAGRGIGVERPLGECADAPARCGHRGRDGGVGSADEVVRGREPLAGAEHDPVRGGCGQRDVGAAAGVPIPPRFDCCIWMPAPTP